MRYNIKDGEGNVVNTIMCASDTDAEALYPGAWERAEQDALPAAPRHITKLAFDNRFTQAESVAIEIAQLDDPSASMPARQAAAALRASQRKVDRATYIDLDRPDTRAGVLALEAGGLLGAGRALEILDAEIQPHEVYQ